MKSFARSLLTLAVVLSVSSVLFAADAAKKEKAEKKGKKGAEGRQAAGAFNLPKTIVLSEEQKTKLEEVKKEFGPQVQELAKKMQGILTAEQKAARVEAVKAAKAAGTKGKDAKAAVEAAVNLSPEQKAQQAEVAKEMKELNGKIRAKIESFLAAEQIEMLKGKKAKAKKSAT